MKNVKVTCFLHFYHTLLYILFINTLEVMLERDLWMPSFLYLLDYPQQGVLNVLLLFQKPLEKY